MPWTPFTCSLPTPPTTQVVPTYSPVSTWVSLTRIVLTLPLRELIPAFCLIQVSLLQLVTGPPLIRALTTLDQNHCPLL